MDRRRLRQLWRSPLAASNEQMGTLHVGLKVDRRSRREVMPSRNTTARSVPRGGRRRACRHRSVRRRRPWTGCRCRMSVRCSGRMPTITGWLSGAAGAGWHGRRAAAEFDAAGVVAAAAQRRGQEIHRRRSDEAGDEQVRRRSYNSSGLPVCSMRRPHDDDLVAHRHRLDLVVGDVHRGRLQAQVQFLDLDAHRDAQLGVEVDSGSSNRNTCGSRTMARAHGDALALAARELARVAVEQGVSPGSRRPAPTFLAIVVLSAWRASARTPCSPDRHVRVQRVVLEHHRDVAPFGGNSLTRRAPMRISRRR